MMPTKTNKQFIEKAKAIHGDKYDYNKTNYINNIDKVVIKCKTHGYFYQRPSNHLMGNGCRKCSSEQSSKNQRLSNTEIINRANIIHNNKYNYDKLDYVSSTKKITVTCPLHGDFQQYMNSHLQGFGCKKCAVEKNKEFMRDSLEEMLKKFNSVHGYKFDYSCVNYLKSTSKVCIICKKHGKFWQTPKAHIQGQGCPICNESKGEILIDNILKSNDIIFKREYKIPGIKEKYNKEYEYDFYLIKYNLLIEFHGKQHYERIAYFHKTQKDFDRQIFRDENKREHAYAWGYKYLEIKYDLYENLSEEEFTDLLMKKIKSIKTS